ncbi:hypothetical protein CGRA01v4_15086 [Colletotrichum graminicola]|nr:hypothetical protein CGRA01v4_15086 [Colletotrichum graminicola]
MDTVKLGVGKARVNDLRKANYISLAVRYIGNIIRIYNRFKRKLTIVSIVNNLGKAINGVFKSFKDVNLMMRYLRASSPARYSYIDIDKVKTKPLIASEITIKEALLWRMMGMPVIRTKNVNFDCYMYNSVVLEGEYEHKSRP